MFRCPSVCCPRRRRCLRSETLAADSNLVFMFEFDLTRDFGLHVVDIALRAAKGRPPAARAICGSRSGPSTTSATTPISAILVRPRSSMTRRFRQSRDVAAA